MFRLKVGSGPLGINLPAFRHSIERMDPAHYLSSPYFEHWLTGVATMAVEARPDDARRPRAARRRTLPASRNRTAASFPTTSLRAPSRGTGR